MAFNKTYLDGVIARSIYGTPLRSSRLLSRTISEGSTPIVVPDNGPWTYQINPSGTIPSLVWSDDFLLELEVPLSTNITTEQWVYSNWTEVGDQRSVAVRVKSGNIEIFISTSGGNIIEVTGAVTALASTINYISIDTNSTRYRFTVNGLKQDVPFVGVPHTSTGTTWFGLKDGVSNQLLASISRIKYTNRSASGDDRDYNFDGALTTLVDSVSAQDGTITGSGLHEFTLDEPSGVITDTVTLATYDDPERQAQAGFYALIGQSNMVGRADIVGGIDDDYSLVTGRVLQYGNGSGTVKAATNPLDHQDENAGDMGMWLTMCNQISGDVLLAPAARGGTGFITNDWNQGDGPYNSAVMTMNNGFSSSKLNRAKAVLWCQGENDADTFNVNYLADLQAMRVGMIEDTNFITEDTPWIVIEIKGSTSPANVPLINADLASFVSSIPNGELVTTQDLSLFDTWHYDAPSQRTIGDRCYTALNSYL